VTPALRLTARPPFDGRGLLDFLAHRTVLGVDTVEGSVYRRAGVAVAIDDEGATVDPATEGGRARRLLDLDADPAAIGSVLRRDPVLAPLVRSAPGLRVPGAWDGFEIAMRAVVGQQVTVAAARTLLGRILDRCGGGGFPTAEAVLSADLDGIGMPGARVRTLLAVARAVVDREIVLDGTASIEALLAVPGIGPWTASYMAMRLGDGDAFPVGDVGLRNAAARLGLPTAPRDLAARAEAWRPWRAYATLHLWRTLG
jgi:AraC family transcriptional regulator, regulatory protein of adaptative response / DNA-3-methyladenine glycosylase II